MAVAARPPWTTSGRAGPSPAGYCFLCDCERVLISEGDAGSTADRARAEVEAGPGAIDGPVPLLAQQHNGRRPSSGAPVV